MTDLVPLLVNTMLTSAATARYSVIASPLIRPQRDITQSRRLHSEFFGISMKSGSIHFLSETPWHTVTH